jgi:hypothetical protein
MLFILFYVIWKLLFKKPGFWRWGRGSVDVSGEAQGGFRNGSRSSGTKEENGLRGREFNSGRAGQGMDAR